MSRIVRISERTKARLAEWKSPGESWAIAAGRVLLAAQEHRKECMANGKNGHGSG